MRIEPVGELIHLLAYEATPALRETLARISHCQARPPREVVQGRRAVTREVARDQLGNRFVASHRARRRYALFEQRVGVLRALERATADDRGELGGRGQVSEQCTIVVPVDACGGERRAKFGTRERAAAFERAGDGIGARLTSVESMPRSRSRAAIDAGCAERSGRASSGCLQAPRNARSAAGRGYARSRRD